AATSRRTPVIHLETCDHTGAINLNSLRVLATNVEHRTRPGEHCMGAQAVAEDLAADLFLRERKPLPAIARTHHSKHPEFDRSHRLHGRAQSYFPFADVRRRSGQRLLECRPGVPLKCPVTCRILDLQDGSVEQATQDVEGSVLRIAALL